MIMNLSMRNHTLIIVVLGLIVGTLLEVSAARGQESATPAHPIHDWQENGPTAISPNSTLEAHTGPKGEGIFIKNLSTGEDKELLKDANGNSIPLAFAFSPDGVNLIFTATAGMTRYYGESLYRVDLNGPQLAVLVGEEDRDDLSADMSFGNLSYSPDGKSILLHLSINKRIKGDDGVPIQEEDHSYMALVSATGEHQRPQKLLETDGSFFWSTDGGSIYYEQPIAGCRSGSCATFYKYDLATQQSEATPVSRVFVLGKVPGEDAVFVRQKGAVTIARFDGSDPTSGPVKAAAAIPLWDNQQVGRIDTIRAVNDHQLLLVYKGNDQYRNHLQIIEWVE